jgi:hypothetical protein
MKKAFLTFALVTVIFGTPSFSFGETTSNIEALKSLEGTWISTNKIKGSQEPVKVSFKVFGHGKSVEETSFIGTPNESISIYYPSGSDVMMSHFCSMDNISNLNLSEKSTANTLNFEMANLRGATSPTDPHVHSLRINIKNKDHIKETWTLFNADGKMEKISLHLVREN